MKHAPDLLMQASRLDAVAQIAPHLAGMDRSFDRITGMLARLTGVPIAFFALVGRSRPAYLSVVGMLRGKVDPDREAFARACVARDEILIVGDAQRQRAFAGRLPETPELEVRFYAGVPVHAPNGMPIGALCAADMKPRDFDGGQIKIIRDLREMLEELLLLRSLAVKDPFTGLYSRRYFDELLDQEWRRARRRSNEVSLLRISVDHFADYIDQYGSGAGDDVLAAVATEVRTTFRRAGDVAARYTGEELVVLLPVTDAAAAAMLGERLRSRVARRGLQHAGSPRGQITVSIGCATAEPTRAPDGLDQLLTRAEEALLMARAAGGDRLVSDAPPPTPITAPLDRACWG